MAKPVSSIVSLLGLVQSIVINLIKRVESLGGSENDVRRLANPDDPLLQQIAILFRSPSKGRPGLYFDALPVRFVHWPTVCNALRSRRDTPRSKSLFWSPTIVWANALVDPKTDEGKRLAFAFPEFWSDTYVIGPVPWSIVCKHAGRELAELHEEFKEATGKEPEVDYVDFTETFMELGIPFLCFNFVKSREVESLSATPSLLPDEIDSKARVGTKIIWNGKEYITVENRRADNGEVEMGIEDRVVLVESRFLAMDL